MNIKWKIIAAQLLIFIIVIAPLTYFIDSLVVKLYIDHVASELREEGERFSSVINDDKHEHLQHMISTLKEVSLHNYMVTDEQGQTLMATRPELFERRVVRERMSGVLQGAPVELTDRSTDNPVYIVGYPIMGTGEVVHGALFLVASLTPVDEALFRFHTIMLAVVGVALLLAGGFSYAFASRMVQPLLRMKDVTMKLAGGEYGARVDVNRQDEIGTLARSINQLGKQLKSHEEQRLEFLANITHELRTPLSYIRGYSQVLEQGLVQNEVEKEKYLRLIMRESQRMQRLVNDLAEQAELGMEGFQFVMDFIDLRELVPVTIEKLIPIAKEKKIEITYYTVPPTPMPAIVMGDRDRLEQVLINMLQNSVRYSEEGGRVVVMMHRNDKEVEFQIKDSGIGIPKKDLPHIFERFHRVEKSRNRERGGMGLGLAIVKQILDKHGGRVWVESEVGVGTVFYFTLPLAQRKR